MSVVLLVPRLPVPESVVQSDSNTSADYGQDVARPD